jgi:hypothetical protein
VLLGSTDASVSAAFFAISSARSFESFLFLVAVEDLVEHRLQVQLVDALVDHALGRALLEVLLVGGLDLLGGVAQHDPGDALGPHVVAQRVEHGLDDRGLGVGLLEVDLAADLLLDDDDVLGGELLGLDDALRAGVDDHREDVDAREELPEAVHEVPVVVVLHVVDHERHADALLADRVDQVGDHQFHAELPALGVDGHHGAGGGVADALVLVGEGLDERVAHRAAGLRGGAGAGGLSSSFLLPSGSGGAGRSSWRPIWAIVSMHALATR